MNDSEIINAVLLALVVDRVKAEVGKMIESGATSDQVNDVLPAVLTYYTTWQQETLASCLDALSQPPSDPAPLTPLRRN